MVGSDGVSAAHVFSSIPPGSESSPIVAVSCPSASLCVAVDGGSILGVGHIFTSTSPAGGAAAWTKTDGPSLASVSCPSVSLCVGVTGATFAPGGPVATVYTSTDPTGGAGTWTADYVATGVVHAFTDVSCPSVSLCVIVNQGNSIITSTNPTGGAGAGTRRRPWPRGMSAPRASRVLR